MNDDEARLSHVIGLANRINHVLSGENVADAQTALTIAVTCAIVSTSDKEKNSLVTAAHGFSRQLHGFVRRDDIVEWIKANTANVHASGSKQ